MTAAISSWKLPGEFPFNCILEIHERSPNRLATLKDKTVPCGAQFTQRGPRFLITILIALNIRLSRFNSAAYILRLSRSCNIKIKQLQEKLWV